MTVNQNMTGSETVSINNAVLTAGDYTLGSVQTLGNCCDTFYHYYPNWYPSYHLCEKSKIEQSFKIIGKLLESKIIEKELTVKDFMKLVNDIAEII